jgi:hypothetical protein
VWKIRNLKIKSKSFWGLMGGAFKGRGRGGTFIHRKRSGANGCDPCRRTTSGELTKKSANPGSGLADESNTIIIYDDGS